MIRCELAISLKGPDPIWLKEFGTKKLILCEALINGIYFSMLWALAPLLVTLVSFFW